MAPALLPDVLRSRHGAPLLLALVYVLAGQRLGLPLALQQAAPDDVHTSQGEVRAGLRADCRACEAARGIARAACFRPALLSVLCEGAMSACRVRH
jgi:hypothetical protein